MVFEKISKDQYFEAILQVRYADEEILKATVDAIEKDKSFVSKIKKLKSGVDFYVSSRKTVVKVGKHLKNKFGGITKSSSKLHSRDHSTGKEVKRITICYFPPKFKKGEVVKFNDKILIISGFKEHISGTELITGKKFKVPDKAKKLTVKETTISKTKPHLEIIHPETFQSMRPENTCNFRDRIRVVVDGKKLWIIE